MVGNCDQPLGGNADGRHCEQSVLQPHV